MSALREPGLFKPSEAPVVWTKDGEGTSGVYKKNEATLLPCHLIAQMI